jgi:hypothetical protein
MHGPERRAYYGDAAEKLSVFVGGVSMSQKLSFDERLESTIQP